MDELIARLEYLGQSEKQISALGIETVNHPDLGHIDWLEACGELIGNHGETLAAALRSYAEREKELVEVLTDIEQDTERSALLVGFAHSAPTRQELQDRLDGIQACARAILLKHKAPA